MDRHIVYMVIILIKMTITFSAYPTVSVVVFCVDLNLDVYLVLYFMHEPLTTNLHDLPDEVEGFIMIMCSTSLS